MRYMKKIAVLFSGGVDSSVALSLLAKKKIYNITVFYLKIWLEDELSYLSTCPWEEDLAFIRATCTMLNIPLEIVSLQKTYKEEVVERSIALIKLGYTPNPDVFCNSMVKFGSFYKNYGKEFDYIATGHYAKNVTSDNWHYLYTTNDTIKDQTYFLAYTPYTQLQKVIFPLGEFSNKKEVRQYAEEEHLPAALRKDSQGICFLGKIPFSEFIAHHCGKKTGTLIDFESKKIMGTHDGFWFYTIGQRQGIGLAGGPFYVVAKDHEENIIYISKKNPYTLFANNLIITVYEINYLVPKNEYLSINNTYIVKLRHGSQCNLGLVLSCEQSNRVTVQLQKPDQGIANGQFMVFYSQEGKCIGSGIMRIR